MAARTGMANLIGRVRVMCDDVSTADVSDDTIQNILDKHRLEVHREQLAMSPRYESGTAKYYDFFSNYGDFEEDTTANAFIVEDSTGTDKAPDTVDYVNGHIQYNTDQQGEYRYLTARSYDIYAAAADVWRLLAGQATSKFDFSADDAKFSRGQWFRHCTVMADHYDRLARPGVATMMRGDVT